MVLELVSVVWSHPYLASLPKLQGWFWGIEPSGLSSSTAAISYINSRLDVCLVRNPTNVIFVYRARLSRWELQEGHKMVLSFVLPLSDWRL